MTINEKYLAPAPCGHIHYLKRELLDAIGVDIDAYDANHGDNESIDVSKYWPLPAEFEAHVEKQTRQVMDAHEGADQQAIEGIDSNLRYITLARIAHKLEGGDPQLCRMVNVLMVDALLNSLYDRSRAELPKGLAEIIGGLFSGLPSGEDEDEVPPGTKIN